MNYSTNFISRVSHFLRKFHFIIGIKKDVISIGVLINKINRNTRIKEYFSTYKEYKLHIGSNVSLLNGWLCSDLVPQTKESIYLDATIVFPFKDKVFDYVYSEHMIEHISRSEGLFMLTECYRVLKKNGKIRIATPDLEKILQLYSKKDEQYGKDYIKWISDCFIDSTQSEYSPLVVVNTMFRNWSHCFLYDADFLASSLKEVGFSNITRYSINESDDENLKGIEQHHLNVGNLEMVEFETLILEATKL